jgi:hypothetical protein
LLTSSGSSGENRDRKLRGCSQLGSPVFYWLGRAIKCVPNTITETNALGMGGVEESISLRLFVILSDFQQAFTADSTTVTVDSEVWLVDSSGNRRPVTGRKVTFRGQSYRVTMTAGSADGEHIILTLGPENR